MNTTDCIRLRKGNLCRLDMKPCKEKCPLRKTKEEYEKQQKQEHLRLCRLDLKP